MEYEKSLISEPGLSQLEMDVQCGAKNSRVIHRQIYSPHILRRMFVLFTARDYPWLGWLMTQAEP